MKTMTARQTAILCAVGVLAIQGDTQYRQLAQNDALQSILKEVE
jgi:hypothetical protein